MPAPFRSAECDREGVDFAVERNGAGGVGAMAEAWYTGRPAGLVLGGPGCLGQAGVRGVGARSRAVFGGPARLVHAGVQGAGMPRGRAVFGGLGFRYRAVFGGSARLGQDGLST